MIGTEDSRGGADDPLFYVDDAGETAFGRLAGYTCSLYGEHHVGYSKTATCIGVCR